MNLKDLSIRARVAYGALCLEKFLKVNSVDVMSKEWSLILENIWEYTQIEKPGNWHYKMAELTPSSVEFDAPFNLKEFEYFTEEEHDHLKKTYKCVGKSTKKIIELIFEIGTLDLYSSITDCSPRTLSMLEEILNIVEDNGLRIPSIDIFKEYHITTNKGWGNSFKRSDVVNDDDYITNC